MRDKIKKGTERRIGGEVKIGRHKKLLALMAVCTILEGGAVGWISGQTADCLAILLFVGVFYSVFFLAGIELSRKQHSWFYGRIGNYRRFAFCYMITCVAAVIFIYLPEFARPILLLSMGMSMASTQFVGMIVGIFHGIVYVMCGQENVYVLICYLMLILCGCFTVSFLKKKNSYRWGLCFLFQYIFGCIMIFSYLCSGQLDKNVLLYGVCNGIISIAGAVFLYHKVFPRMYSSKTQELKKVLSENFSLAQAMQNFSRVDYEHARRVSNIAKNCAQLIEADPYVAAAGGFYYRLGRMQGEPYVENGVALAKSNYLPKEVVEILKEYNGEKYKPSTLESAVVHIVDSVVTKFDVLDKETLSSSWNQDILVYQTMNENSAAGLYDKAGFSMNMFLKIRDYLIKEAKTF
ncbi:hypothetical protein AALA36_00230 [Lachnospiraceae bacterium 66-29]